MNMGKDEREILRAAIEEEDKPSSVPLFNKYIVPLGSILLLILLVAYFVIGPVHSTIRGQIASSALQDNEYSFGEYLLIFYNDTAFELESIYREFQEVQLVETSVCLQGEVYDNTYGIQNIFRPRIIQATFNSVTFEPCPDNTLVMLHTHPYKSCLASDLDLETFQKNKERSPHLLMLVMCEQRRYTLYD